MKKILLTLLLYVGVAEGPCAVADVTGPSTVCTPQCALPTITIPYGKQLIIEYRRSGDPITNVELKIVSSKGVVFIVMQQKPTSMVGRFHISTYLEVGKYDVQITELLNSYRGPTTVKPLVILPPRLIQNPRVVLNGHEMRIYYQRSGLSYKYVLVEVLFKGKVVHLLKRTPSDLADEILYIPSEGGEYTVKITEIGSNDSSETWVQKVVTRPRGVTNITITARK